MDEQARELLKLVEETRNQVLRDYYSAFKVSDAGRRVFVDMEKNLDRLTYKAGRDALEMAYNEGRRSVLLDLRAAILHGEMLVHPPATPDLPPQVETRSVFDGDFTGPAAND